MSYSSKHFKIQCDDGKLSYKNHHNGVKKQYEVDQLAFDEIAFKFYQFFENTMKTSSSIPTTNSQRSIDKRQKYEKIKQRKPIEVQIFDKKVRAKSLETSNDEDELKTQKQVKKVYRTPQTVKKQELSIKQVSPIIKKKNQKNKTIEKNQQIASNQNQERLNFEILKNINQSKIERKNSFLQEQKSSEEQYDQTNFYEDQSITSLKLNLDQRQQYIDRQNKIRKKREQFYQSYSITLRDIQYVLGKYIIHELDANQIKNIKSYQYRYPKSQQKFPSQKRKQLFAFLNRTVEIGVLLNESIQKSLNSKRVSDSIKNQVKQFLKIGLQESQNKKCTQIICQLGQKLRSFLFGGQQIGVNLMTITKFYQNCSNWRNRPDYIHVTNNNLQYQFPNISNPKEYLFKNSFKIVSLIETKKQQLLNIQKIR